VKYVTQGDSNLEIRIKNW